MTTACQDVRHRAIRWLFHAPYQPQPMHLNEPRNGQPESQAQPLSQLPHQKREQRGGSAPLLAYRPVCIQAHPGHSPDWGKPCAWQRPARGCRHLVKRACVCPESFTVFYKAVPERSCARSDVEGSGSSGARAGVRSIRGASLLGLIPTSSAVYLCDRAQAD